VNAKDAKERLSLPDLLEKLGYYPEQGGIKRSGNEIWYKSPFNPSENTASFHVSRGSHIAWIFKCFSSGHKGSIIDFVIAHEGYGPNDIKSALAYLRRQFPGSLFEYVANPQKKNIPQPRKTLQTSQPKTPNTQDTYLKYLQDLPLKSGKMLSYLRAERGIPDAISQKYLRLVRYLNTKVNKTYWGIGMKNRAGGIEIRSASNTYTFKSVLNERDITILPGQNPTSAFVFEGFLDALSFMTIFNDAPPGDCIIMHSVNTYEKAKTFIKEQGYSQAFLLLDNDKTGAKYVAKFKDDFDIPTPSLSHLFTPFKDVNEAHVKGHDFTPILSKFKPLTYKTKQGVLIQNFSLNS
jgi:hypothetical protein